MNFKIIAVSSTLLSCLSFCPNALKADWTKQQIQAAEGFCNAPHRGELTELCAVRGRTDPTQWFADARIFKLFQETGGAKETGPTKHHKHPAKKHHHYAAAKKSDIIYTPDAYYHTINNFS